MSKPTTPKQTPTTVIESARVLATGSWYAKRDCPSNPKADNPRYTGRHYFVDIQRKTVGAGEYLVTSRCKHCGGLILDCPTISVSL